MNTRIRCTSPPEDLMGADKLFAEARVGNISGPLKLGALRVPRLLFSAVD
jgi:hypothetical protein